MRPSHLALFLLGGSTLAIAQTQAPLLVAPNPAAQTPSPRTWTWSEQKQQPSFTWSPNLLPPQAKTLRGAKIDPKNTLKDASIDPQMIHRPPSSSIGALAPATPILQQQYPGLVFQPINTAASALKPIPIAWDKLKVQKIPTQSVELHSVPVESSSLPAVRALAK